MRNIFLGAVCVIAVTTACTETAPPAESPADTSAAAGAVSTTAQAPNTPAPAAKKSTPGATAPAPRFREVTIPAGTPLKLTLDTAVSSSESVVEDPVRAKLTSAIVIDGVTALPAGAEVTGSVLEAQQAGRVKGRASVSFGFDRVRSGNDSYTIQTPRITREAEATKGADAAKIGIGAGAGAVIGAIAGGKKGAAVGTAIGAGAGAGTGAVLATRGDDVSLPAGSEVETTLGQPLRIQVAIQ